MYIERKYLSSGTKGIAMVCVSFLNTSSIAQMRFTI
jgi:hypothetical protein